VSAAHLDEVIELKRAAGGPGGVRARMFGGPKSGVPPSGRYDRIYETASRDVALDQRHPSTPALRQLFSLVHALHEADAD
jgi:hypothetical protein